MTMMADLSGKHIIVTGASSGLGAHFARVLSGAGARVALVARRKDRLAAIADEIAGRGGARPLIAEADVGSVASIRAAVAAIVAEAGTPDGLINNAGIVEEARALDVTEESWDAVIDTNLKGAWFFASTVASAMIEAGRGGSIVNIASITGLRPRRRGRALRGFKGRPRAYDPAARRRMGA
ncbi:MAG: SDR family NAD(P)-dependent oxidoreductase, partial [Rhodomicrobium sp.]|nr:SDR family NAD(P)-dependent oxidoreductase [Rhodomicrobium sp.]